MRTEARLKGLERRLGLLESDVNAHLWSLLPDGMATDGDVIVTLTEAERRGGVMIFEEVVEPRGG